MTHVRFLDKQFLLERLVFPEVRDGQAQRVDENEVIRDVSFENEYKVGWLTPLRED
jgi:hypothetical protein